MSRGELALAFISGGIGFAIADFIDRYAATYNPSTAGTTPPTNKFTAGSTTNSNGTLANTLNIASPPGLLRIGIGIGVTAVPAIGAYLVKNSMGRAALQGMMLGAGIKLFSTLWNAYVMGNLLAPAASDPATMQASLGARVYPAETVAKQNLAQAPVPYSAPNPGLSAPPQPRAMAAAPQQRFVQQQPRVPQRQSIPYPQGVGDVGPFAVAQGPTATNTCPPGTGADSSGNGVCATPCDSAGTPPYNGQCPPTAGNGCGPQQVVDSVTGGCANPCPDDGSAPANGICGMPANPPTNFPSPEPPAAPPVYQQNPSDNGAWGRVNIPNPRNPDCGLGEQLGDYLGFMSMENN